MNATPETTWPSSAPPPPAAATSDSSDSPHRTRSTCLLASGALARRRARGVASASSAAGEQSAGERRGDVGFPASTEGEQRTGLLCRPQLGDAGGIVGVRGRCGRCRHLRGRHVTSAARWTPGCTGTSCGSLRPEIRGAAGSPTTDTRSRNRSTGMAAAFSGRVVRRACVPARGSPAVAAWLGCLTSPALTPPLPVRA